MEGSVAAGQGAAGADGGDAQGQAQQQQGPSVADLAASFDQFAGTIGEQMQQLQQGLSQQQQVVGDEAAQGDQGGEIDLSFLDDAAQMGADPNQIAQQLQEAFSGHTAQAIQQALAPVQEQLAEERFAREAADLVGEFPQLGDPEYANTVMSTARQVAEQHGYPQLSKEGWFIRQVHMGIQAAEMHNNEGAESPQAAHLEGGSGAAPGSNSQVDRAAAIVNAGGAGRSVLPFG